MTEHIDDTDICEDCDTRHAGDCPEPEPCGHRCGCTSDMECPHDCPCGGGYPTYCDRGPCSGLLGHAGECSL